MRTAPHHNQQAQRGPFGTAQDGERKSNRERSRTAIVEGLFGMMSGHDFSRADHIAGNDFYLTAVGPSEGIAGAPLNVCVRAARAGKFDSCRFAAAARRPSAERYSRSLLPISAWLKPCPDARPRFSHRLHKWPYNENRSTPQARGA